MICGTGIDYFLYADLSWRIIRVVVGGEERRDGVWSGYAQFYYPLLEVEKLVHV